MPAHKVKLRNGAVYWVGRDNAQNVFVHSANHHVMDFGMIRLYVVGTETPLLVDRLWIQTFASQNMSWDETYSAVVSYLRSLRGQAEKDIAELLFDLTPRVS